MTSHVWVKNNDGVMSCYPISSLLIRCVPEKDGKVRIECSHTGTRGERISLGYITESMERAMYWVENTLGLSAKEIKDECH